MPAFLASDALPLAILALIVAEGVALTVWRRRSGRGPAPGVAWSFLGAGFALVAALWLQRRVAEASGPFALALLAALLFHVWHLVLLSRR
jgi:hypothetical protein